MYMFFALIHKRCRQPLRGEQFWIEYNLNGWNTDGSFTVDDSNSVSSVYKILPIAQKKKKQIFNRFFFFFFFLF